MKAFFCKRFVQFGVHPTEVVSDKIFYIPEMNVILYKSEESFKSTKYGVCLSPELLDEVKKHVLEIEVSKHIDSCKEVELNADAMEIRFLISAHRTIKKKEAEMNVIIKKAINSLVK